MIGEPVLVTFACGVADVRLNRPSRRNAIDDRMVEALIATGADLAETKGLRAVVLSGEGAAFCAGLDFSMFEKMRAGELDGSAALGDTLTTRTHGIANMYQQMVLTWRELAVPVIAALHGVALGGGLQIALGADLRFADPGLQLSVMEVNWGLIPDCAGTILARELVSEGVMRELTYTGRMVDAAEALAIGLVNRIVDDPYGHALQTAREIAGRNPEAVRAAKRLFNAAPRRTIAEMLLAESVEQDALIGSANQIEAVAARLAGRSPIFQD